MHRSPLFTLAGLVAFFAIMFGVNLIGSRTAGNASLVPSPSASAAAPSPPAPVTPAPTTAPPSATPTPTADDDEDDFPDRIVYAGRTRDGSAALAVAVLGDRAAAYLCDGRSVELWMSGRIEDGEIALRGANGGRLAAELDDGRLVGEVTARGEDHDFRLSEAKKPAGLYRAKGSTTTIGWIVLPDGSQVGLQTTGSTTNPAPQLDPDNPAVTVDGEDLTAAPVEGDEAL